MPSCGSFLQVVKLQDHVLMAIKRKMMMLLRWNLCTQLKQATHAYINMEKSHLFFCSDRQRNSLKPMKKANCLLSRLVCVLLWLFNKSNISWRRGSRVVVRAFHVKQGAHRYSLMALRKATWVMMREKEDRIRIRRRRRSWRRRKRQSCYVHVAKKSPYFFETKSKI